MRKLLNPYRLIMDVAAEYIIALSMALGGAFIIFFPGRGTALYVEQTYGITANIYGGIICFGGLVAFVNQALGDHLWPMFKPLILGVVSLPFIIYLAVYIPYIINTPGASPSSLVFFVTLIWFVLRVVDIRVRHGKLVFKDGPANVTDGTYL